MRRVVITGLGAVTPLGRGARSSFKSYLSGRSGIRKLGDEHPSYLTSRVAARVPDHHTSSNVKPSSASNHGSKDNHNKEVKELKEPKWMKEMKFIRFALEAAEDALLDAKWKHTELFHQIRTGVSIGSAIGGIDEILAAAKLIEEKGYRRLSPHFISNALINSAAGKVALEFKCQGPNLSPATACATGAHAIGDAYLAIKRGDADLMLAGGTESCINHLTIAGFCRAKALSTKYNDKPEEASRPFDKDRDGFVIGEGAGIVVLEELESALNRRAPIYAELVGYGVAGDAHHMTAPPEDGYGAERAMMAAIRNSDVSMNEIDYVNAHATGTMLGDAAELRAMKTLFGEHIKTVYISASKGSIGHLLGAAGAVEAIFTILAVADGVAPPTLNLKNVDDEFKDLNIVGAEPQPYLIRHALSNSFGFGGTNASLLFKKVNVDEELSRIAGKTTTENSEHNTNHNIINHTTIKENKDEKEHSNGSTEHNTKRHKDVDTEHKTKHHSKDNNKDNTNHNTKHNPKENKENTEHIKDHTDHSAKNNKHTSHNTKHNKANNT